MYKIPANTVFTGKNLVFVPECPSTNLLAIETSRKSAAVEGTVVITDCQTAGRGQRGNSWEAEPGLNLTFSLILKPGFLALYKQFLLNVVTSLALKDYLGDKTTDTFIKWPNDILVHQKKISGILIENQVQGGLLLTSVVGIGFNLNQTAFRSPAATSLALVTGRQHDKNEELAGILGRLESRYLRLRSGDERRLVDEYLDGLYWRGQPHLFSSGGIRFEGTIEDVDDDGRLRVRTAQGLKAFGIKEIQYIE